MGAKFSFTGAATTFAVWATSLSATLVPGFVLAQGNVSLSPQANVLSNTQVSPQANGMDVATRNILINKLTHVQLNLASSDPAKVGVTLRLADLYAERARIDAMSELNSGCLVCQSGKEDRLKALSYYNEVANKVPDNSRGKVLAQVGHLYELTGQEKLAILTYEKILGDSKMPEILAEANFSLAEVYFKKRSFSEAKSYYQAVVANPHANSKGLAAYRLAWCEFNLGDLNESIQELIQILKSPQADKQFHEEVSRDLATFFARRQASTHASLAGGNSDAEVLFELSPESAKISNVMTLAIEAERLGQVQSAILIWRYVQQRQSSPLGKLEGHVRLAQLEMDQKERASAISDFEMALRLWSELGTCGGPNCDEIRIRIRKFVLDWNRAEKANPTEELLAAYGAFLKVFADDLEMKTWAAQVAGQLKKYQQSVELYQMAAQQSLSRLPNVESKLEATKDEAAKLEVILLGAIEVAELSKESVLLDSAYDSYLKMSREKKRWVEVRYQKAHLLYERGQTDHSQYVMAAQALREVALLPGDASTNSTEIINIKKQAADLSLDTLVLLNDDVKIEAWASEYSKVFVAHANEFSAISQKAVLTQAASAATVPSNAGAESAWKILSRFKLEQATESDRLVYYKNRLILAEKLAHFSEAREAADALLQIKSVSAADREYALSRKAWLAELVLDFEGALQATERLEAQSDVKWLKLAMYAELASKDPKPFYAKFIKMAKGSDQTLLAAMEIVRGSKDPLNEINLQKGLFEKNPQELSELYLEVFARSEKAKEKSEAIKRVLSVPALAKTSAGKIFARIAILDEVTQLRQKFSNQKLDGGNQRKLAQALKGRVEMLNQVERLVARAVVSDDWISQVVTLQLLAKEHGRFYEEILALPVPAGLQGDEEQQYLSLLTQQAAPHQVRSSDANKKLGEFWADANALPLLEKSLKENQSTLGPVLLSEVELLRDLAPEALRPQLTNIMESASEQIQIHPTRSENEPSLAVIEGARRAVRENPMGRLPLQALLSLEKQKGNRPMIVYLESRIQSLESVSPVNSSLSSKESKE
jgi:hypothetical protein